MSLSWAAESCAGRSRGDHLFWTYGDDRELATCVQPFIHEGLGAGERVAIAAAGPPAQVQARFNPDGYLDRVVDTGQVVVLDVESFPAVFDVSSGPEEDRELWRGLAALAEREGYTGFRLVGDGTAGVVDPAFLERFIAFDLVLTELCRQGVMTCLCLYDVRRIGAALHDVACAHPQAQAGTTPFVLHQAAADALVLAGSLDALSAPLFATALSRIHRGAEGAWTEGRLVIDASGVEFLDHRALLALDRLAAEHELRAVLRGAPPLTSRLLALLQLEQVAVESGR